MQVVEGIEGIVNVRDLHYLERDQVRAMFQESGALFKGHFELLSGQHTHVFFRFAQMTQVPEYIGNIGKEITAWARSSLVDNVDVVLSTSRAGMLLAHDIARELHEDVGNGRVRAVYADSDVHTGYPRRDLLDGFSIEKGERVLVVNDLTTTGTALNQLITLARSYGGEVIGVSVFAQRSRSERSPKLEKIKEKYEFHAPVVLNVDDWGRKECGLCKKGVPLVKSKEINSVAYSVPLRDVMAKFRGHEEAIAEEFKRFENAA